uniref:Uncharacterized protein n=1 Tax=Arundo donax TaxID=35708 RepID=A0A0A8ZVM2_ARUDO
MMYMKHSLRIFLCSLEYPYLLFFFRIGKGKLLMYEKLICNGRCCHKNAHREVPL